MSFRNQFACDIYYFFAHFLFCLFVLFVCFLLLHPCLFTFSGISKKTSNNNSNHSNNNNNNNLVKSCSKLPSWSQAQLKEAIASILTQQMRFTQSSAKFKIPKGTLYDNILGKTKRSRMLEEIGLKSDEEMAVLEFACDVTMMPYNRRTSRPLASIVNYVKILKEKDGQMGFKFPMRKAFKWWWAFCKKYSIISLYYKEKSQNANMVIFEAEEAQTDLERPAVVIEKDMLRPPPPAHNHHTNAQFFMHPYLMPQFSMASLFHQYPMGQMAPQNLCLETSSRASGSGSPASAAST
jgi:hypothetical protein